MSASVGSCQLERSLAPSILSADFSRLGEELAFLEKGGAKYVHIDVMDGRFVPNMTIGMPVVESLRRHSTLLFDVHLMIQHPGRFVAQFAEAGADIISFHIEASDYPLAVIEKIKRYGKGAAMAVKPMTPVESVYPFLPLLDMVLIMSVEPGFGGQTFQEPCLRKAAQLRTYADGRGLPLKIQMDGGITVDNVGKVMEAGVNVVVTGSAIFDADDKEAALKGFLAAMGL